MAGFVKAKRVGPNAKLSFGFVRTGHVHDIPADAVGDGWERVEQGSRARVTEPASGPGSRDFGGMTVRELSDYLAAAGVEVPDGAKKADLVRLVENHAG